MPDRTAWKSIATNPEAIFSPLPALHERPAALSTDKSLRLVVGGNAAD
jgi:hypothetical protein